MSQESQSSEYEGGSDRLEGGDLPLERQYESVETDRTYTVEDGDTLRSVAERFYGSAEEWERIYEANQDRLANPDQIYPGQELAIP